ncbi:MAG TPA: fused MFS/spermidine synthase [Terriglobales bacterium]|nr:fused MFS/spermidine synthase [Terriglobales bacterium]
MTGSAAAIAARTIAEPSLNRRAFLRSGPLWYAFFFVSGFPALLYQIVWQRALFTLYGVNIESVTLVVTGFMLGLGLGSLLGGTISRSGRWPLLGVFGAFEILIAAYGVCSLKAFHWAGEFTAGSRPLETGLVAFALVVTPTMLMGSTLPILVSYTVRLSPNVGRAVGGLYAANTLGSALACFCAGLFLMRWLGESKTVMLAAGLNALVGSAVLAWHFGIQERHSSPPRSALLPGENASGNACCSHRSTQISFPWAVIAAGIAGFVALGYEIIWYRLFAYTTAGTAKSFAFLLGAYLAGIGAGSLVSNRICEKVSQLPTFMRLLVGTVFGANVLGFLVGPIFFNLVVHVSYLWSLVPIAFAAAGLGAVFPLLCHIAIPADERVGASTSYLYLSNILGSSLGSYLTGFVLMDILPFRSVSMILTLLGLGLSVALMLSAQLGRAKFILSALGVLVAALFVVQSAPLFRGMYAKMLIKQRYAEGMQLAGIVENRSGVIAVTPDGTVFGGGAYDGRFNVSLVHDANGIQRAFALSFFHANPREVLMIGLSSGSWAQVIANHPQIDHLTIVEINPGYLHLIREVPSVASLLQNPKVRIDIDDGRRWLVRNRTSKFDVIVMNTTYHWRSNASNLLSTEFLELVRQHLNPGGVHFYNTTDSPEVMATGVGVFPFGIRLANFMAVSDSPLQLDRGRWLDVLLHYSIDGQPVFDLSRETDRHRLREVMSMAETMDRDSASVYTLESADHIRARTAGLRLITDDNMGSEWLR